MDKELRAVVQEKDLVVVIDRDLKFEVHLAEKIHKANRMVVLIRWTFVTLDETIFKALFVALVHPHLEYTNQVWCPFKKKDLEAAERTQRRATNLVPTMKYPTYPQCLKKLELPTLVYRRSRGDMTETFKTVNSLKDVT